MASTDPVTFHSIDYILFSLSCIITILVGIVIAIKDRWHSQSSESYLMADRSMSCYMMGISNFGSLISAVVFVGPTAEFYYFGTQFMWVYGSIAVATLYNMLVTIPKFFRLGFKITSAYEYLEHRFSLKVRMTSSLIFTIGTLFYMALILYAACLILAQVSALDIRLCVAVGAFVCMVYTGFGGLKAVVYVDNIQVLIMMVGAIALAVKGVMDAGGIHIVWETYKAGQRATAPDLDPSPWKRHTVWNLVLLNGFAFSAALGSQQITIQRYVAVRNMRQSQMSIIVANSLFPVITCIVFVIAIAAFATVGGNEPLLTKEISNPGQIFPYFLMKVMGDLPGLPGLVVAASFAAALSTMSSGQNSLAAVLLEDFVKPIYRIRHKKELNEKLAGNICRITGVSLGLVIMGLGITLVDSDDMIFSLSRCIDSLLSGPIFVLMFTGMFIPFVEQWGALTGCLCSLAWAIQMYAGSLQFSNKIGQGRAPLYMNNFTEEIIPTEAVVTPSLYDTSYTWYVFLDVVVGVLVACTVSAIVIAVKFRKMKVGRLSDLMPDKCYLYTLDDFLVGLGIKSMDYKQDVPHRNQIHGPRSIETPKQDDGSDIPLQIIANKSA